MYINSHTYVQSTFIEIIDKFHKIYIHIYMYIFLFSSRFAAVSPPDVTDRARQGEEALVSGSAPKFVRLPTDLLVAEGEDAVFECAVTGEPKPDLRWYSTQDDGEIIHDGRIIVSILFDLKNPRHLISC